MKRLVVKLMVIIWVASSSLIAFEMGAWAKSMSDAQPIEELSDLGSVRKALNVASPISLVVGAWEALEEDDLETVLDLTNDCIDRFGKRARQMQAELDDYVTGSEAAIRSHWALNDVATAFFIQGKALEKAKRYDEAKKVYKKLIDQYTFGQCWDPRGWFWKPAEVAAENVAMIDSGVFFDFGDYKSSTLVMKAWAALEQENIPLVLGYANKCIQLYEDQAREMQAKLLDYPQGSNDEIFSYWALNDVATAHFIKARAYMIEGNNREVINEFKTIRDDLFYGQCWDPRGWWWKPATEGNNWLKILNNKGKDNGAS